MTAQSQAVSRHSPGTPRQPTLTLADRRDLAQPVEAASFFTALPPGAIVRWLARPAAKEQVVRGTSSAVGEPRAHVMPLREGQCQGDGFVAGSECEWSKVGGVPSTKGTPGLSPFRRTTTSLSAADAPVARHVSKRNRESGGNLLAKRNTKGASVSKNAAEAASLAAAVVQASEIARHAHDLSLREAACRRRGCGLAPSRTRTPRSDQLGGDASVYGRCTLRARLRRRPDQAHDHTAPRRGTRKSDNASVHRRLCTCRSRVDLRTYACHVLKSVS